LIFKSDSLYCQVFSDDDDDDGDDGGGGASEQILTQLAPETWGMYDEPPPDIPVCGFTGELCPNPIAGQQNTIQCNHHHHHHHHRRAYYSASLNKLLAGAVLEECFGRTSPPLFLIIHECGTDPIMKAPVTSSWKHP